MTDASASQRHPTRDSLALRAAARAVRDHRSPQRRGLVGHGSEHVGPRVDLGYARRGISASRSATRCIWNTIWRWSSRPRARMRACMVSEDSKATMPRMIDQPRALLDGSLYSFVQPAGSFSGTLHRGGLYSSRCICFLPQYFEELDRRWPGAFSGMFERFGDTWDEAQSRIIMSALMGTSPQYRPGSALLIQARIEQMAAALAPSCAGDDAARCSASTRSSQGLPLRRKPPSSACSTRDAHPTSTSLRQMLFVSRSHLCAAFSRETGQSVRRYAKARRIERAKVLLASGDSVAYVAARLGWPRPSAFSQAFKQVTGTSQPNGAMRARGSWKAERTEEARETGCSQAAAPGASRGRSADPVREGGLIVLRKRSARTRERTSAPCSAIPCSHVSLQRFAPIPLAARSPMRHRRCRRI